MASITLNIYTHFLQDGFLLQFEEFSDAIFENFQNSSCTPIKFFVEENLDSWHPKTHSPHNYLQSFYLADLIHACGGETITICRVSKF